MVRKGKKNKSGICIFVVLVLMFVIVAFIFNYIITLGNNQIIKLESDGKASSNSNLTVTSDYADERTTPVPPRVEPDLSAYISSDQLNSSNAILLRLTDDTVLMEKNSEEKIYPASLTKMMTAIVAIEHLPDLKGEIKLTNSTFLGLYDADASMAGFVPGEQVMAIDLLYGVMLPSGAECCIGLAEQIAGSEQNFVNRMNQKAQDLGMEDTYIENVTGLHSDNHYTTVKDLSILLSYALQNDTFREIFTSSRHSTTPTNKHPGGITFYSTMFEKLGNQNFNDGEILGGKTGYTEEAGLCLASLAKVGQQEYILISAGAKGDHRSEQYHITDAVTVYSSLGE
jgi:D-alanyl-D-alanine carboxypeptidase (penicillin-binding protein 5/6)